MTLLEFMEERYKNREDKDNIFGVGVSDAEFRSFIIDYLLGEDWYVVDPLGQTQINEIALNKILEKYSKRYRKECKGRKRGTGMTKEQQYWEDTQEALSRIFDRCEEIDPQSGYDMLEDIQFVRGFINKHKPQESEEQA